MIDQNLPEIETPKPAVQKQEFERLKGIIHEGDRSQMKVIEAAKGLFDGLWKQSGADSVTNFFLVEFGYEKSYVSRLRKMGTICAMLKKLPNGQQPQRERQVRPLIGLLSDPEKLEQAWLAACKKADGNPSGTLVEEQVSVFRPSQPSEPTETSETSPVIDVRLRDRVEGKWKELWEVLKDEDPKDVLEVLFELADALEDEMEAAEKVEQKQARKNKKKVTEKEKQNKE